MSHIIHGDSLEKLKTLDDNSVDSVITDPPYGYSFMGKDWDKAVPSVDIWRECLRVLKPGAFCMVMSAPRSDVQNAMISRLMEAGFRLDFTPIYWTYASGFPKAGNIGKLVMKRNGDKGVVIGKSNRHNSRSFGDAEGDADFGTYSGVVPDLIKPTDPQAKALDGSYAGFQPKPAVEVIIVAMKPLSERTYVDQAIKNGHGITWLDDGKIPYDGEADQASAKPQGRATSKIGALAGGTQNDRDRNEFTVNQTGRFPANLLVSGNILHDHSRFFDLDAWADTLPFLAVPKASKGEKNKGLDGFEEIQGGRGATRRCGKCNLPIMGLSQKEKCVCDKPQEVYTSHKNHHPTVKPLKLMSYLITLTTRPGDTILDPFVGSGTTAVAAHQLGRNGIGIEREEEYAEIARARLSHVTLDIPQLPVEMPEAAVPPTTITQVTQASLFDANL